MLYHHIAVTFISENAWVHIQSWDLDETFALNKYQVLGHSHEYKNYWISSIWNGSATTIYIQDHDIYHS